ncbi:hypothetical protein EDD36DRAFT_434353 [Exophiala viscosa]|uniref:Secreted protein n=1 Tax=Exophiala viscosa TaxID=2486360 RepID=A0AAN6DYE2_9EURO|nr:hypothetical protein EDD36DRAFT_434353 [Exophiala viscosa]
MSVVQQIAMSLLLAIFEMLQEIDSVPRYLVLVPFLWICAVDSDTSSPTYGLAVYSSKRHLATTSLSLGNATH